MKRLAQGLLVAVAVGSGTWAWGQAPGSVWKKATVDVQDSAMAGDWTTALAYFDITTKEIPLPEYHLEAWVAQVKMHFQTLQSNIRKETDPSGELDSPTFTQY